MVDKLYQFLRMFLSILSLLRGFIMNECWNLSSDFFPRFYLNDYGNFSFNLMLWAVSVRPLLHYWDKPIFFLSCRTFYFDISSDLLGELQWWYNKLSSTFYPGSSFVSFIIHAYSLCMYTLFSWNIWEI